MTGFMRRALGTLTLLGLLFAGCAAPNRFPHTQHWQKSHSREIPILQQEEYPQLTPKPVEAGAPGFSLVYPWIEPGDTLGGYSSADSVFLYGSVTDVNGWMTASGVEVPIHPEGGWLAWAPFDTVVHVESDTSDSTAPVNRFGRVSLHYEATVQGGERVASRDRAVWFRLPDLNPPDYDEPETYPFQATLTVIDSVDGFQPMRNGWPGTYDMFLLTGTELFTDGYRLTWRETGSRMYRVPLGDGEVGWIRSDRVEVDTTDSLPPAEPRVIYSITCDTQDRKTHIRIPLRGKPLPFRIEQVTDNRLELTLYGAVSWTDVILQPTGSNAVDEVRWQQVDPTTYRLNISIHPEWFWGWDAEMDTTGSFVLTVEEAPAFSGKKKLLNDLHVVVDPGHGGWNAGARGPTGASEGVDLLPLAKAVEQALIQAGAKVTLTRTDPDVFLSLTERVLFARAAGADVVLSLHFNGLPQGTNPASRGGTSTHYYHRHSKAMATALFKEITGAIGWEGDGVRYQDLAIPRLTFCPSVLIETLYLMMPFEEHLARDPRFRETVGRGVVNGLSRWLAGVADEQSNRPAPSF